MLRLVIFSLLLGLSLAAQTPPAGAGFSDLSAQRSSYDQQTGDTLFSGDARFRDADILIEADEIRFQRNTDTVVATGKVSLTRGAQRMLADRVIYQRRERSFTVDNARLGRFPLYLTARQGAGSGESLTFTDAHVTIGEPGLFKPTLHADRLTVTAADRRIRAEHGRLGLGEFRLLSFPTYRHSLQDPLLSYFSGTVGHRGSLGVYGVTGLRIPVSQHVRLGGTLGLYSKRGVMFGPSGDYGSSEGERPVSGSFNSGFINDHGEKFNDLLGRPVPEKRAYVTWTHAQQLTDQLSLTGALHYWKDSEIVRDFNPGAFFSIQQPDTFLESAYTGRNYFVTTTARFQPNTFHAVQQRLPEVRYDLLPIALPGGFYEQFNAGLAVLRERPLGGGPTLASDRLDAYYALTRPFTPREWLGLTPVAGGRLTHYQRATGTRSAYTRVLGELGLDAEIRSSAVFDYQNKQWKIDGLRHLLTPRISYRYIPEADRGQLYIPAIDRSAFSTYLPPLGLGATRNIDQMGKMHRLRLGIDNRLQTRAADYGSRDLLIFNLASDVRLDRQPGEHKVSDLHLEMAALPAPWLQFDLYQRLSPRTFAFHELNAGVTVKDGETWALRLSNQYLEGQIQEYSADGNLHLNEAYEVLVRLRYDARRHRFNERSVGLRHNLENTWRIEYHITQYDGPRREGRFGVSVSVRSIGF